jgi:outer membrane protein assembly factor BamB
MHRAVRPVVTLASLFLASPLWAGDWPQILGPGRNGVATDEPAIKPWGQKGPAVAWEYAVGRGNAGPVVAGGRVVVFHRIKDEEVVDCLSADAGKLLWRAKYPTSFTPDVGTGGDGPLATPLIADGAVFVLGAAGRLVALELADGKERWQRDLAADYRAGAGYFGFACSPILEAGRLVVNVGGPGAGVVAFDPKTGKEAWKATDDGASYSSPVAATVAKTRHLFFFTRDGLLSLDPESGKERFRKRWRARIDASVNAATPLVVGNEVFISASYQTGALLVKVGDAGCEEVWKQDEVLSNHFNTSVECDGFLYGVDGRQERSPRLRCVEWKTGKVRWTEKNFGCATLTRIGKQLLALTEGGELVLFDASPTAYTERARATVLGATCRAAFALAGGRVYARDAEKLVALEVGR